MVVGHGLNGVPDRVRLNQADQFFHCPDMVAHFKLTHYSFHLQFPEIS